MNMYEKVLVYLLVGVFLGGCAVNSGQRVLYQDQSTASTIKRGAVFCVTTSNSDLDFCVMKTTKDGYMDSMFVFYQYVAQPPLKGWANPNITLTDVDNQNTLNYPACSSEMTRKRYSSGSVFYKEKILCSSGATGNDELLKIYQEAKNLKLDLYGFDMEYHRPDNPSINHEEFKLTKEDLDNMRKLHADVKSDRAYTMQWSTSVAGARF